MWGIAYETLGIFVHVVLEIWIDPVQFPFYYGTLLSVAFAIRVFSQHHRYFRFQDIYVFQS